MNRPGRSVPPGELRLDTLNEGRRDFLTREPVRGTLLSEILRHGPIPPEEALQLAIEIGKALGRAHSVGRVHGGICPFSIVISDEGVHITDPPSSPVDRAAYQAPEEFAGERADGRGDIFAFGALVYELASGQRAFPGSGPELRKAILTRTPAPFKSRSAVHAAMSGVIAGCLDKNPATRRQRIQNAAIELRMCRTIARTAELVDYRQRLAAGVPQKPLAAGASTSLEVRPPAPLAPFAAIGPQTPAAEEAGGGVTHDGPAAPAAPPVQVPRPQPVPAWQVPPQLLAAQPRQFAFAGALSRHVWILVAVLTLTAGSAAALALLRGRSAAPPVIQFSVNQPENTSFPGMPAVSPDGKYLTFSAVGQEGRRMLWLRPLNAIHASMIPGTEDATAPFWSPDSGYIAFFANHSLKKVKAEGGATPEVLCPAETSPGGGSWSEDGTILFAPGLSDGLYRVAASGGKVQQVLGLDESRSERGAVWPHFLPDGKHFVFYLETDLTESSGVYAGSVDSRLYKKLFSSHTNAVYSGGYLLYINDRSLMAQKFDVAAQDVIEQPVTLSNDIGALRSLSLAPVSVSKTGVLVYQRVGKPEHQMVWFDRAGRQLTSVAEPGGYGPPRISPISERAVFAKAEADLNLAHLWFADPTGPPTRLTEGGQHEGTPVWSPDGARLAYFQRQEGRSAIYVRSLSANSKPELLLEDATVKYLTDWTHDGKYLLFYEQTEGTQSDIWAYSFADRRAAPILDTVYSEGFATLSPDGKWMAFQSDQSGRNEVYVQPFEGLAGGTKKILQVSRGGGLPRWRSDGAELFYTTTDGRVMAVAIRDNGVELQPATPQKLFQTRPMPRSWNLYDVSGDGQRFLVNVPLEWTSSAPITVVTNWAGKLKE